MRLAAFFFKNSTTSSRWEIPKIAGSLCPLMVELIVEGLFKASGEKIVSRVASAVLHALSELYEMLH